MNTYTLYTNIIDVNNIDNIEAYNEYLIINNLHSHELDIYNYLYEQSSIEWSDFLDNLKYSGICQNDFIIVGSLGLWDGRRSIDPLKIDNLIEAIERCCNGDYITIKKVNGHIGVTSIHHDGTNSFDIFMLNDKGVNAKENANLESRCYHKAMPKYLN